MCMAMSCTSSLKSSVRATKSDSQLTSTMHAELAAVVDVAADQALLGGARGLLAGRGDAALAQHDFGFADVALGFHQGASCIPSCPRRCARGGLSLVPR